MRAAMFSNQTVKCARTMGSGAVDAKQLCTRAAQEPHLRWDAAHILKHAHVGIQTILGARLWSYSWTISLAAMYMYEGEAVRLWDRGLKVCLFIEIVTKAQSPTLATKLSFFYCLLFVLHICLCILTSDESLSFLICTWSLQWRFKN